MRYTGTRYTQEEARAIQASARATIQLCQNLPQRDGADRFVAKTVENARVAEPEPAPQPQQTTDAATAWCTWVDSRIEAMFDIAMDATGEVIGHERGTFRQELKKRDAEIASLRREVRSLRDELELRLKLTSELAAARAEVAELQRRAPNFEGKLNALQGEIEKVRKTASRSRAELSVLDFGLRQTEQRMTRTSIEMTSELTSIGQQTRAVLRRMQEEGLDVVIGEMQPASRLVS